MRPQLVVLGLVTAILTSCGDDPPAQSPALEPAHGPPGTLVTWRSARIDPGQSDALVVRVGAAELAPVTLRAGELTFSIPPLPAGSVPAQLAIIDGEDLQTVETTTLTVEPLRPVAERPGVVLAQVTARLAALRVTLKDLADRAEQEALYPAERRPQVRAGIARLDEILAVLERPQAELSAADLDAIDALLVNSGAAGMLGAMVSAMQTSPRALATACPGLSCLLLEADGLSFVLSVVSGVISRLAIGSAGLSLLTGGATALVAIELGKIALALKVLKAAIDGLLPTDLERVTPRLAAGGATLTPEQPGRLVFDATFASQSDVVTEAFGLGLDLLIDRFLPFKHQGVRERIVIITRGQKAAQSKLRNELLQLLAKDSVGQSEEIFVFLKDLKTSWRGEIDPRDYERIGLAAVVTRVAAGHGVGGPVLQFLERAGLPLSFGAPPTTVTGDTSTYDPATRAIRCSGAGAASVAFHGLRFDDDRVPWYVYTLLGSDWITPVDETATILCAGPPGCDGGPCGGADASPSPPTDGGRADATAGADGGDGGAVDAAGDGLAVADGPAPDAGSTADVAPTADAVPGAPAPPRNAGASKGDPHLVTFDGVQFHCHAVGELTLVRSTRDDLEVQVRTKATAPWSNASVNIAVAARIAGDVVAFYRGGEVRLDHQPAVFAQGRTTLPGGGALYRSGASYALVWPDNSQLRLHLGGAYSFIGVDVYLADARAGQVTGLLGNFDSRTAGELVTRGGATLTEPPSFAAFYGVYTESWRIGQQPRTEWLFDYAPGETTETYTDRSFPRQLATTAGLPSDARQAASATCRAAGVPAEWMDACILDVALTGDERFAHDFVGAPAPRTTLEVLPPPAPADGGSGDGVTDGGGDGGDGGGGDPGWSTIFADDFDRYLLGVNVTDFQGQWTVARGSVDVIGPTYWDLAPGHGRYLDLDGSSGQAATLSSRPIALTPGTYWLRFSLGGSQRGDTNTVVVTLGAGYEESFTLPSGAPLASIGRIVTVTAAGAAPLTFRHEGGDNQGLLLDDVSVARAP
jgi:hypothetical protein